MQSRDIYTYERYNFRVMVLVFLLLGIFFTGEGEWIGTYVCIVFIVATANSYTGIHLDPEQGRYRKYDRFWTVRIGRWEALPPPSYVGLVRINLSNMRKGATPLITPEGKKSAKAYKVNLAVEGPKRYISICRGPFPQMRDEALRLGEYLDLKVMDMSTSEKKWIR